MISDQRKLLSSIIIAYVDRKCKNNDTLIVQYKSFTWDDRMRIFICSFISIIHILIHK